jgi:hypothetical protein
MSTTRTPSITIDTEGGNYFILCRLSAFKEADARGHIDRLNA